MARPVGEGLVVRPRGGGSVTDVMDVMDVAASAVGLEPAFQPVVELSDGAVVGFEALARWPTLQNPDPQAVFAHAAATGCMDHLDQMCIDTAIESALRRGLTRDTLLMLNCEPLTGYVDRAHDDSLARAHDRLQVMFELTERSLLRHPHALLRKVAALRADGFGIALDDVGAHPDSLALLDVICPDVIKLDLRLVQSQPSESQARTLAAVLAHHERTGSVLLAEGIESEEHLEQALAVGASLGQGYMFGRPAPLDDQAAVAWTLPPMKQPVRSVLGSPFDMAAERSVVRTVRKETLMAFTRHIETQAKHAWDPPMVLTALQGVENFSGPTRDHYCKMAESSPLVAVFGQGLPHDLGPGVRGVNLDPADPLCTEWTVVTLGPHHAAALIARERQTDGPTSDADRRFDFTISYDRLLVTMAARNLLERIA